MALCPATKFVCKADADCGFPHGICGTDGTCQCTNDTARCPELGCKPPPLDCGKGGHWNTVTSKCDCLCGWTTDSKGACTVQQCPCVGGKMCNGGQCTKDGCTECPSGMRGPACNLKVTCPSGCFNGNCLTQDKCTCDKGWTGDSCGCPVDANGKTCGPHGKCSDPGSAKPCSCDTGWSDDPSDPHAGACSVPTCEKFTSADACSAAGSACAMMSLPGMPSGWGLCISASSTISQALQDAGFVVATS